LRKRAAGFVANAFEFFPGEFAHRRFARRRRTGIEAKSGDENEGNG
jgi:hypothetical protein